LCGRTKEEHDENLKVFLNAAKECHLTLNEGKCKCATETISLLGYHISKGVLQPDPDHVKPVLNMPVVPRNSKELQRLVGLFAYYAQWIPRYCDKIRPLVAAKVFPLDENAAGAVKVLMDDLSSAALGAIDEKLPFVLKTNASENAISATLNQQNRPVAFVSRTLNSNERRHVSVEKEALAIVQAVRKWAHLLTGRRFKIATDRRSVAFMYDNNNHGKIKNDKVLR